MSRRNPIAGDVRLSDVADAAGVSVATASRVLNNSEHGVSGELRSRVRNAAEQLGYVPNAHAQVLAGSRNDTIGVLVHDMSDPFFAEIASGCIAGAAADGLLTLICDTARDPRNETTYVAALHQQRVRAIVLTGSGFLSARDESPIIDELSRYVAGGGRVASLGDRGVAGASVVCVANESGAYRLASAVFDYGHRRVAVVTGPMKLQTVRDRLAGIDRAFRDHGLTRDPELTVSANFGRDEGYDSGRLLLARSDRPTAIIVLNDTMAVSAMTAARHLGLRVPADVSIVGFDDIPHGIDVVPALTTARIPMRDLGMKLVDLALSANPQTSHVGVDIIIRQTLANAPSSSDPLTEEELHANTQ